jgi:DNA invertase Pin-like site-specific DNA recombinase
MDRKMARIGYGRVSTAVAKGRKRQHVGNQVARLTDYGCERVFTDEITGKRRDRPGWDACLAALQPGDTLVVTKLDRIGRSLINLVDVMQLLGDRGIDLKALDQDIDTSTANGKLIFHIMAALAEWEATMTAERTVEGLEAARERHGGKLPSRGPSITADQIETARTLARSSTMSAGRIADVIGVSRATLYRHVDVGAEREKASATP